MQRHLAQQGCFAPAVWAGPAPPANGHVLIERYVAEGTTRDGHEPAQAFCADWTRQDHAHAPALEESRAFVAEYEEARGAPFGAAERRLLGTAFAYSVAYTARCGHAFGKRERDQPGSFHALLARHGEQLLAL